MPDIAGGQGLHLAVTAIDHQLTVIGHGHRPAFHRVTGGPRDPYEPPNRVTVTAVGRQIRLSHHRRQVDQNGRRHRLNGRLNPDHGQRHPIRAAHRAIGLTNVEADADHGGRTADLNQNARQLAPVDQDIVRPFQPGGHAKLGHRLHHRHTGHQRDHAPALRRCQQRQTGRQRQRLARHHLPRPVQPSPTRHLTPGDQGGVRAEPALPHSGQQVGVGRAGSIDQLDPPDRLATGQPVRQAVG